MTAAKRWESLKSVAVLGNYLPRQCGIATFTTDLTTALMRESGDCRCYAVVMNDVPEGYRYPEDVRFEINQNRPSEYRLAADFLNMNQVDAVCVQHEYGIFGGACGAYVLELLRNLRMPVVTTLHTVLKEPTQRQREVLRELSELSDRLVVMSRQALGFLEEVYRVPKEKIAHIPHGIPDVPFVDPNFYKDQFAVEGRTVILTFGLLSPGKGIEYMIDALLAVVRTHPDVAYLVLGATHPHVKKASGEEYRLGLQRRARDLGVAEHLIFHNRFVELEELCEFLGSADLYVTPYLNESQIVSGTLAYACGSGKAVVSTPYWYAVEMLAEGRGRIVPFRDANALAAAVNELLDNEVERSAMRKKCYNFCRAMVWKEVARSYLDLFVQARQDRMRRPRAMAKLRSLESLGFELPSVNLEHLRRLTDDTGVLQHAKFTVPDRTKGYSTDDNARALIVTMLAADLLAQDPTLRVLTSRYLSFLDYALNDENGRFRNFMKYDRTWLETVGSEDSHGRSIWALGVAVAMSRPEGQVALTLNLFQRALRKVETFTSPRAWAFSLIGIHAYLRRFGGDSEVRRVRATLAKRLFGLYERSASDDWPWFEETLAYANAKVPHALLLSGQWMYRPKMVEMGLQSLDWLARVQTSPQGHFVPVGNKGWHRRSGERASFDQQPIEAHAMIEASLEAFNITRDDRWLDVARMCLDWFLGRNDLRVSLYDHATGGCRDGLNPEGVNQNEGAESTLAWLLSLLEMQSVDASVAAVHHLEEIPTPGGPESAKQQAPKDV